MVSRLPAVSPFANSKSVLSIVIGNGPTARIIGIQPWVAAIGGACGAVLLGWYLVATIYFVFRDEMLAKLMNQQAEMQYAYEDRLAALRNQIDKVTSRQLLDQNSLEGKLHELLSRQAQLETRQAVVASLAAQPVFARARSAAPRPSAIRQPDAPAAVRAFAPVDSRPSPAMDAFELRTLTPREPNAVGGPESSQDRRSLLDLPAAVAVAAARDAADQLERRQLAQLDDMQSVARGAAQRLSAVFAETGLDPQRFAAASKTTAQGGPLVALGGGRGAGAFEHRLTQLQLAVQQADRMQRIVSALPITRPMPAEFETTSSFGARADPFTRGVAMHTGIDFRAPTGTPVRTTAGGKVVEAGYTGGYGNMVEVEHGNGLTTRYAHLSAIEVDVGAQVAKGAVVGRVGSTGRSTGPHLHYETRIDGEPTDPLRFIRAGDRRGDN